MAGDTPLLAHVFEEALLQVVFVDGAVRSQQ